MEKIIKKDVSKILYGKKEKKKKRIVYLFSCTYSVFYDLFAFDILNMKIL